MKKIAIVGKNGQLGQYLLQALNKFELIGISRDELDLTKTDQIHSFLLELRPDLIINASAYTAVDKAESEPELAALMNDAVPRILADYAASEDIPFIHYSTDYVFAGDADQPYKESDQTDPQGQYGITKLAGEKAILATSAKAYIFRTAWVYSQKGGNFYKTMLNLSETRSELNVVNDQVGSPTYAASIAHATAEIVEKISQGHSYPTGIYHMTCQGETNWSEFAKKIFALNGKKINIHGIPASEYPTPAKRPSYSVLDNQKLIDTFNVQLPNWDEALLSCVKENIKG